MPDPAELRVALASDHPEAWVAHLLTSFRDAYLGAFDAATMSRHLGHLRSLTDARPVHVEVVPGVDPGTWTVEVFGLDAFQFLSTLGMLLTIHGLSIDQASVFTSEPPAAPARALPARRMVGETGRPSRLARVGRERRADEPDRRRRLVDVLQLRQIDLSGPAPDWDRFRAELADLAQLLREKRHDQVQHRLIGRFVAALHQHRGEPDGLEPLDLTIDPQGSDFATVVRVRARDSLGFLSLTASALSLSGVRIVQADIRTGNDGRADDTLWVTDRAGNKLVGELKVRALELALTLIEHFSIFLPHAADPETSLVHFSRFANDTMTRSDFAEEFAALDRPEVLDALVRLLGDSQFLWNDYLRDQPELILPIMSDPAAWASPPSPAALEAELLNERTAQGDVEARRRAIRRLRDREVFRAGLRVILDKARPEQFASELTAVAEVVMRASYHTALAEAADEIGSLPSRTDASAAPSALCVLGKFGGRELGFGSDLEVMVVYDDTESSNPLLASDYFDAVIRGLRGVMGVQIGGTFELDFRLRPHGKGGAPATSYSTFVAYYQAGGPAWSYERQALIRLRPIAGDAEFGRRVVAHRDRFVYGPEPFDPAELGRMRAMQVRQLVEPGTINAKFSPGALVDVEYFVQALQIAFGREDKSLRTPNTLETLAALQAAARLDPETADTLRLGYHFCRELIDALRVVRGNAGDLTVPPADSDAFATLARRMRRPDLEGFRAELQSRLEATRLATARLDEFLKPQASGVARPKT